jgi:phage/plasmid-associated DNA primase
MSSMDDSDLMIDEKEMIIGIEYSGLEQSFCHSSYFVNEEEENNEEENKEDDNSLWMHEIKNQIKSKNNVIDSTPETTIPKKEKYDNYQTINLLIDNFECFAKRSDNYNDWFPDVCAIFNSLQDNVEQMLKAIHSYSELSSKYDKDSVEKEIQKIFDRHLRVDKRRTIGSMMKIAKESDKKKYEELFSKKKKPKKNNDLLDDSIKQSTEYGIAKVFVENFGDNFKMVDIPSKKSYVWNKDTGRWKLDNGCSTMRNMISVELKELYKIEMENTCLKLSEEEKAGNEEQVEYLSKKVKNLLTLVNKLEKTTDKNNIVREIADLVVDTEFEKQLNCNTDLFAFNNCVLDLTTMTTRPAKYDDYISWSCGYDYNADINQERLKELKDLLKKIFPDPNVLQLVLEVLSCGFSGKPLEYFVVFNGSGGNGKGLIDEFIKIIFGDYGYIYAPVCLLTEKDKTGPNPEKAKLHNKRIVIMKEPSSKEKLNNDRIKDMTGGGNLSGRDLYAGKEDCEILMALILIMECNVRPLFQEDPTDGDIRRIVDILFPNKFTNKKELIDNETVFQAEVKYKSLEWKLEHRNEFVFLLLEAFKKLKKNDYVLNIPKCVEERSKKYINESFTILKMFNDFYEYTEDEDDVVKISDMFSLISTCSAYTNLTKQEKRLYNKSYFVEFFSTHTDFKGGIYCERKKLKGTDYRNILWKYKLKEID